MMLQADERPTSSPQTANCVRRSFTTIASGLIAVVLYCGFSASAQASGASSVDEETLANLRDFTQTIAVSGYEDELARRISAKLAALHPQRDSIGNITVTLGSGAPHRVLAAPIDEPGYVVSRIDEDGYLRVQRLPQSGLPAHFNELQNAQPMRIETHSGKWISGVVSGLSIHLEPGRTAPPDPDDIDNLYIDVGATSRAEVARSGIDVLSPLAPERKLWPVGNHAWSSTAVGDRYGAALLVALAHQLANTHPQGTTTFAFVAQQWSGARGLIRILESQHPDELIYIGRAMPAVRSATSTITQPDEHALPEVYHARLGSGVWVCGENVSPLEAEIARSGAKLQHGSAPGLIPRGYGAVPQLPFRSIHLALPLGWPVTAAETLDENDLDQLEHSLASYLGVQIPATNRTEQALLPNVPLPSKPTAPPTPEALLQPLILSYGVSEHEDDVRETVKRLLPAWAHTTTDAGGNLILQFGKPGTKPQIAIVAHMDELGFRIRAINADGSLDLENKGGGTPAFYWGHPALVHASSGMRAGVLELPDGWESSSFHFPKDFRAPATMWIGASSPQEVESLGVHVGDTVTIPKDYRTLLGSRVSARSLDDRVGCAALLHAVWALGPEFHRDVTFVWSTREELGLFGAAEFAAEAARTGQTPSTVFAIDTFVSSDSPLESHRFADAKLGAGFVVRAVDNSNISPWGDVAHLRQIAAAARIPMQYGVTGGGNDGSAFLRYGSVDLPLAWPLRYSHSPGELIDTRDLDALSAITAELAKRW